MSIQQKEFSRFIKLLHDNDCLEYVILIGSWAEFLYQESGMLTNFHPNIKTLDMDFLIKNLRKPSTEKNIPILARNEGYLVENDILTGVTKIYDKAGLEIEFLINKKGAGLESALKTNLGVTAQALRHMDIITRNMVSVDYFDMQIYVPTPEAYAIHKIVINNERGPKKEKDQQAIKNIWPLLDANKLQEIVESLTKRERHVFDEYLSDHGLT